MYYCATIQALQGLGLWSAISKELRNGVRSLYLLFHGINGDRIWEEDFADNLVKYVKGYADIKEIPKSQRYINIPRLKKSLSAECC